MIAQRGSDSAKLDNTLDLLVHRAATCRHAHDDAGAEGLGADPRSGGRGAGVLPLPCCLQEPWDGPAALAFTDGVVVGQHARPQRPAPGALCD